MLLIPSIYYKDPSGSDLYARSRQESSIMDKFGTRIVEMERFSKSPVAAKW